MADFGRDGTNSLGYLGVRAVTPPDMKVMNRAPLATDVIGYALGTQWLHVIKAAPLTSIQYVLSSVERNIAVWIPLHGSADNPALPNYSVALGIGTPGLSSTGPIATLGAALVSNGTAANPSFGVVSVSGGGTGLNVTNPYAVYVGGTTGEGPVAQVASLGTIGQVLTSNGNGSRPTWAAGGGGGGAGGPIAVQTFTTPGNATYFPTAGMGSCIVEIIGGGGAGGPGGPSATGFSGAGGGAGGYCRSLFTAAAIGASQTLVVGVGGLGISQLVSGAGASSTFGTSVILTAGGGGAGTAAAAGIGSPGGTGGVATGGNLNVPGQPGSIGFINDPASGGSQGGSGGSGIYGGGGSGAIAPGLAGTGYGSGGAGNFLIGLSGTSGIVVITEYGPYGILPPVHGTTLNVIVYDTPGAGTYTPSSPGVFQVMVEVQGGGSGGYGTQINSSGSDRRSGPGGSSGGYCRRLYSAAEIGASKPYIVGSGGLGVQVFAGNASNGLNSTFSNGLTLMTGGGGLIHPQPPTSVFSSGGIATGGYINIIGQVAPEPFASLGGEVFSTGANSFLGIGGALPNIPNVPGNNGTGYGSGGGPAPGGNIPIYVVGGNGASGVVIITEYIN